MGDPQAATVEDKRRLLQIIILIGAVVSSIIISLVSLINPQVKAVIIVAEGIMTIILYFVIGRVVK